jgi:asparagine synthase (glutamine-hydrolysing)
VLREAMKGVLPKVLYEREKFAFMAPPAHTDEAKQKAMNVLAEQYLDRQALIATGLLDPEGVEELMRLHDDPNTPLGDRNRMDAQINHLLGVQMLHKHFVATDVPAQARQRAVELGWHANA